MLTILSIITFLGIIYGLIGISIKNLKLPLSKPTLITSIVLCVIFVAINTTLFKISAQEVGVIITPQGVQNETIKTGWHIVMPWNTVKKMDKTVWVYTLTSSTKEGAKNIDDAIWSPTADGIKMGFDISVNWHIDPDRAAWIYSNISGDQDKEGRYHWMEENIIRPAIKSIMPLTVSRFTPIECYSEKRNDIQRIVQDALKKELKTNGIIVDVAQIRDVYYNKEYEAAINNKKLAEQEVLKLVQVTRQKEEQLKQAEIDKNMAIARAEGEAKALQIKGESLNKNPQIIQLEWIGKWNGVLPVYQFGSGQNVLLNLNNQN